MVNAEIAYSFSDTVELALSGKNLTDTYYEYAWFDGAQIAAQPGRRERTVTASVRLRF